MRNYYEILGVRPDVPTEIIRAVYKTWMHALGVHPDLGGDEEAAKEINAAYETLSDPARRVEYDRGRAGAASASAEKRRAPRFAVDADVACCIGDEGLWRKVRACDASALGMRLKSDFEIAIGTHVSIAFQKGSSSGEALVRWVKRIGKDQCEFGIEFYKPISDILKRLGFAARRDR